MITAIYSKPYSSFKTLLWDNLKKFYSNYLGPHLVLGDFNDIIYSAEKFGVLEPSEKYMLNFRLNLEACNMFRFGVSGPRFNWSNLRCPKNQIMESLDHFLVNPDWLARFPEASVTHLPRIHSNHCPLILKLFPQPQLIVALLN